MIAESALGAAIAALWAKLWHQSREHGAAIVAAIATERAECSRQLATIEGRIARLEGEARGREARIEAERDAWRARWEREVESKVRAFNAPAPEAPGRPPMPTYDDTTEVRNLRNAITDRALQAYVKSVPPTRRPSPPPRPRPRSR